MSVHRVYNESKENTLLHPDRSIGIVPVANLQSHIAALINLLMNNGDRNSIRNAGKRLIELVNVFYGEVECGSIKVDSNALLNAIKNVTCRDIAYQLNLPTLDRTRIVRDLRLFSNTIRYVLNPNPKRWSQH